MMFQENLVVWKLSKCKNAHVLRATVSGELSSMEIISLHKNISQGYRVSGELSSMEIK